MVGDEPPLIATHTGVPVCVAKSNERNRRIECRMTILLQNTGFALGVKAIILVLALSGAGTIWMAVFADMGASLLVVPNGMRLLRY